MICCAMLGVDLLYPMLCVSHPLAPESHKPAVCLVALLHVLEVKHLQHSTARHGTVPHDTAVSKAEHGTGLA